MADLSQQLQIQKQINQVLSDRSKILKENGALLSKQLEISRALLEATAGKGLQEAEKAARKLGRTTRTLGQNVEQATDNLKDMDQQAKKSAEKIKRLEKRLIATGAAIGALKGLKIGFGMLTNVVGGAFRAVQSFVGSIFNIGKAIISIPFKIFGGLVDMAQGMGSPVFLQALEEVRATFGDIASGSGRALRNSAFEIKREFNSLTKSAGIMGPSFGRVFGYGQEGLAAALKFNAELATELGGSFAGMRDKIKGNFAELAIYRKGLGISAKAQATFMKQTEYAGGDYMKRFKSISSMAIQVGKDFGFSSKEVGITLGKMMEDVKNFGGFTDKQMVQMAVQAKRLGLELEALAGVAEGFDQYDEAAKSAGNLNRVFGMQVDSMKLFQEQDPVARIQQLQKAFKATGKDVSNFTRAQLSYLAANTKLSEADAKLVFSKKGLEMDYNDVQKATQKAKSKELSQAKVLLKLSRQIERVFGSGGKKYKGFFDAFAAGFGRGVIQSREFRKVLRNINRSLKIVERFGYRVGRSFVKNFPGVKDFLGALADFFNPRKLRPAVREMSREIDKFFKALRPGNEKEAFEQFGKNAMGILKKYFGGKGEGLELMRKSFDTITTIIGNLKLIIAEKLVSNAAKGLEGMTDAMISFLDGGANFGAVGDKAADIFGERFGANGQKLLETFGNELIPALKRAAPVFLRFASEMMSMIRKFISDNRDLVIKGVAETLSLIWDLKMGVWKYLIVNEPGIAAAMAGILFGPSIVGAGIGALGTMITTKIVPRLAGKLAAAGVGEQLLSGLFSNTDSVAGFNFWDAATNPAKQGGGFFTKLKGSLGRGFGLVKGLFNKGSRAASVSGISSGMKAALPALKKAGLVGAVVTAGLAGKEAYDTFKKTGSFGRAASKFGTSVVSSLTFGLFDAEKAFDTKGYVDRLATRHAAAAKQLNEKFDADYKQVFDGVKKGFDEQSNSLLESQTELEKKIIRIRKAGDKEGAATLQAYADHLQSTRNAITAAKSEADDTFKKLKTQNEQLGAALSAVQEELKNDEGFGDIYDDHVDILEKDLSAAAIKTLEAKGLIKSRSEGILKLDGDKKKEIIRTLESMQKTDHEIKNAADSLSRKAISEGEMALLSMSRDKLLESVKILEKNNQDSSEARAAVEKQIKLAAIKKAMTDKDIVGLSWSESDMQRYGIEGAYAMAIKAMKKGGNSKGIAALEEAIQNMVDSDVEAAFKDIDVKDPEEEKLSQLEAAKVTLDRIKELENVPDELTRLRDKLAGMDTTQLKYMALDVATAAGEIGVAINQAIVDQGLDQFEAAPISSSLEELLTSTKSMTETILAVHNTKLPSDADRSKNLAQILKGLDEIIGLGVGLSFYGPNPDISGTLSMIGDVQTITDNLTHAVPANLGAKVKGAADAIAAAKTMLASIAKVGKSVKGTVDLVRAINSGGTLTVTNESKAEPINVTIQLNVSAKHLAQSLVQVKGISKSSDQLMTTAYVMGRGNNPVKIDRSKDVFGLIS